MTVCSFITVYLYWLHSPETYLYTLKVHVTPQLASTFITESAVQKSHLISLLITVYPLPWFFIGKDAWSDSCVTARIPRSHSICIVLPFLCYRYTLGFLIVVDVLFQVSKLFLEVFDCPEIQGVVFLQTVVNFVSIHHLLKYQIHEMSGSFLHWLHPLHLNYEMYFFIQ